MHCVVQAAPKQTGRAEQHQRHRDLGDGQRVAQAPKSRPGAPEYVLAAKSARQFFGTRAAAHAGARPNRTPRHTCSRRTRREARAPIDASTARSRGNRRREGEMPLSPASRKTRAARRTRRRSTPEAGFPVNNWRSSLVLGWPPTRGARPSRRRRDDACASDRLATLKQAIANTSSATAASPAMK